MLQSKTHTLRYRSRRSNYSLFLKTYKCVNFLGSRLTGYLLFTSYQSFQNLKKTTFKTLLLIIKLIIIELILELNSWRCFPQTPIPVEMGRTWCLSVISVQSISIPRRLCSAIMWVVNSGGRDDERFDDDSLEHYSFRTPHFDLPLLRLSIQVVLVSKTILIYGVNLWLRRSPNGWREQCTKLQWAIQQH